MPTPKCAKCGNDGTAAGLYLTIDALWDGERWVLEPREDDGGMELDCLKCDHRTPDEDSAFPYGALPIDALTAWRALSDGGES
jgi:hypothetical protein